MNFVSCESRRFPLLLKEPKIGLKGVYYAGKWSSDVLHNCLAVVGSRKMSDYGRLMIGRLIPGLVEAGIMIVSGFMYGVDRTAHEECLRCGGRTVAVLGWGIEKPLGQRDANLYQKIIKQRGLVISEYGGKMEAQKWTFPERNRIVAGLSRATLIIEAAEKSGSLITAALARKYGRSVYAVPGPVSSRTSSGTNNLIKEGKAVMVTGVEEIIKGLGLTSYTINNNRGIREETKTDPLTGKMERGVIAALENGPLPIDQIVRVTGQETEKVASAVSLLEIQGRIRRVGELLEAV